MDTMTTTQHLGQAPGRARRCGSTAVACSSWRQHAVAPATTPELTQEFKGRVSADVAASAMNAYLGNTTTLAGAKNESFIKRHARHLGTGST